MTIAYEDVKQLIDDIDTAEELTGVTGAKRVADMLAQVEPVLQRYLMQVRARMIADEHYIEGTTQRELARQVGLSVNAVSLWLKEYGPRHYVTVRQEDGRFIVEAVEANRRESIQRLLSVGRRVAPARLRLDLQVAEKGVDSIDAEELWHDLAAQGQLSDEG